MKSRPFVTCALILLAAGALGASAARSQIRTPQRPGFHPIEPVETEVEAQIIDQTNAFRSEHGRGPLTENPVLTAEARVFADYLVRTHAFAHDADGRSPHERAQAAGYDYCVVAENLAFEEDPNRFRDRDVASDLMRSWQASPGHRRNLLDPEVVELGVGVASSPGPTPRYVAVQEFGRPASMRFAFAVTNRTEYEASYTFEGRTRRLDPGTTITLWPCAPSTIAFLARTATRPFSLSGGAEQGLCAGAQRRVRRQGRDHEETRVKRRFAVAAAILGIWAGGCHAQSQPDTQNATAFMAQNALADGVHSLPSGVQYKILKSGPANGPHPTPEDNVKVDYEGSLLNGKVFDSSYQTGKPVTFQLKGLIRGWVDALQQMRPGDQWILYVPPSMGYGDQGSGPIPPNSVLVFKLELLAVGADAGPPS
jgi:peptidylprolyl isomerase/FKBP-type peptidyl-prolyl cis-trans isomerase FklB